MNTAYDLIYLVGCAVNGIQPDRARCAAMDLAALTQTAMRHSLTVAAATALEGTVALPAELTEEKYKAIRRLLLFDKERAAILHALEQQGIWYMPLKGLVLRAYYPLPEMRDMADNDILFDKSRAEEVRAVMENAGYTCLYFGAHHHDVYGKGAFLTFEMHRELLDRHTSPQHAAYYEAIHRRLVKDADNRFGYHLCDEDFYVFLLCHLYKHYRIAGTGLRSLLDVYVFNRAKGGTLRQDYLQKELANTGLTAFERDVRTLAEKAFSHQPLSPDEKKELAFYIESDCHGNRGNLMANSLGNDDSAGAKRRYALRRMFPTGERLRRSHPFVSRHKALYPLLVVYRPIKGVVKHRRQLLGEIKILKRFKTKAHRGKYNE